VHPIHNVGELDLTGEMTYAVNFSATSTPVVNGVSFALDYNPPPRVTLVGANHIDSWESPPKFGPAPDGANLSEVCRGIRYALPGAGTVQSGTRFVRAVALHPQAAYTPVATQTYLFVNGTTSPSANGIIGQSNFYNGPSGFPGAFPGPGLSASFPRWGPHSGEGRGILPAADE